jgi:hypothetical protein
MKVYYDPQQEIPTLCVNKQINLLLLYTRIII